MSQQGFEARGSGCCSASRRGSSARCVEVIHAFGGEGRTAEAVAASKRAVAALLMVAVGASGVVGVRIGACTATVRSSRSPHRTLEDGQA
jgi:hypothetical protein